MKIKKTALFLSAGILALGITTACKKKGCTDPTAENYSEEAKKDDGSCTYDDGSTYTADLDAFFDLHRTEATQTFTIDASSGGTVIGTSGTYLVIPADAFVDGTGSTVTGSVEISLIEILDGGDMIWLDAPTTSDGEILVSGGELKVSASSGGSEVYLTSSASISIYVPYTTEDPSMAVFDGEEDSEGDVTWTLTSDSILSVPDSSGGYYYLDWSDSTLGWINCDYFWDDPSPKTGLTVNTTGDHTHSNTSVYLHFDDINSVAIAWAEWGDVDADTYSATNIPEGSNITIVAISEIAGDYYSAFVPITLTTDHVENITLSATTEAEFEADLDAL